MLVCVLWYFYYKRNLILERFVYGIIIEIIWIIFFSIILMFIVILFFVLLYLMDEVVNLIIIIKVIGY